MRLAPRILDFWNSRKISPGRSCPFSLGINNLQGSVRSSLVHRSFEYIRIIDLSARKSTARPINHLNVYETTFMPFHLLNKPPVPFTGPFLLCLLRYLCCLCLTGIIELSIYLKVHSDRSTNLVSPVNKRGSRVLEITLF